MSRCLRCSQPIPRYRVYCADCEARFREDAEEQYLRSLATKVNEE